MSIEISDKADSSTDSMRSPFHQQAALAWGPLCLLIVLVLCSLPVLVHPWYDWMYSDAATNIQTARSLVGGEGYSHLGLPFHIRPPGFAVLIAPVIAGFGLDFYALNLYVSLLSAVGVALLFLHLRLYLGWPIAFLIATAIWLNPFFQRMANQVMAEAPGVAFILAALLVDRWSDRAPSWRREVLLGLSIVLACYVRSISLLLVPAIVLSRVVRQLSGQAVAPHWMRLALERVAVLVAVVVIGLLPWNLRNSAVALPPPADQTMAWSNSAGMFRTDIGDPTSALVSPSQILQRIPENGTKIAGFLGSRLGKKKLDYSSVALASLALLGLFVAAWKRREPAEFFVIGVLASLAVYYDFRNRLLLPVLVLMLPAAIEFLRDVARRVTAPRVAEIGCCGALLLLIAADFDPRAGWPAIEQRHQKLFERCAAIEEQLAPDARLATSFFWHYGVCLDRPVFSLWFTTERNHGWLPSAEPMIDKYEINTVVLTGAFPLDGRFLKYFGERYGFEHEPGSVFVARVRD